ncbi:MAG: hypothetical protein PVH54_06420 [Gammaproteobacteria bacterium]|jgi:hypothetical protein
MITAAWQTPATTGCDRHFTSTPGRSNPGAIRKRPAISAGLMAYAMQGSELPRPIGPSADAVICKNMATGPVASCREE